MSHRITVKFGDECPGYDGPGFYRDPDGYLVFLDREAKVVVFLLNGSEPYAEVMKDHHPMMVTNVTKVRQAFTIVPAQ